VLSRRCAQLREWLGGTLKPFDAFITKPWTLRVGIILGSILMMSKWPLISGVVLWASFVWAVPLLASGRREVSRLRSTCQSAKATCQTLEIALTLAQRQIARLQQELQEAKQLQRTESKGRSVFRRVGLDPSAPRFAIEAVRKAYRRKLHPDLQPGSRKAEAEKRFKEAEAVFDEIWRLRDFS
jgi:hypothetical protein